jgi:hypothetical protein
VALVALTKSHRIKIRFALNVDAVAELEDVINATKYDPSKPVDKDVVPCYDPATMQMLGHVPAMSAAEVGACFTRLILASRIHSSLSCSKWA